MLEIIGSATQLPPGGEVTELELSFAELPQLIRKSSALLFYFDQPHLFL